MANAIPKKFKLSGEHKDYVISKLALYCGTSEIAESLKIDFDVDITPQGVDYYKQNYEDEWRERRKYFNAHIAEVEPFAAKINRIKKRGDLIRDLDDNLWTEEPLIKNNVKIRDDDNNPIMIKGSPNHINVNRLLDSIHKELEPQKIAQTDPTGEKEATGIIILPEKNGNKDNGGKKDGA